MADRDFGREESTFGGRVRRITQVGSRVGGLAAQVVGARALGIALDRGRHSEDLRLALGGLKGPLMKAAQKRSPIEARTDLRHHLLRVLLASH